ncbi:hypothetical protein OQA88_8122 [Cercophora sp. LCS_1]
MTMDLPPEADNGIPLRPWPRLPHPILARSQNQVFRSTPASLAQPKQSKYAGPADWEKHRDVITRLYLHEDKTLKQVKKLMEDRYGFFATDRMFKVRIKRWGLEKNNDEAKVIAMVRIKRERDKAGKETAFRLGERAVDWKDIERYIKRKPGVLAKLGDGGQVEIGNDTMGIIVRTPSPDPIQAFSVPDRLDAEPQVKLHGDFLTLYRDYMDGAFNTGLWAYHAPAKTYHGTAGQLGNLRVYTTASDLWSAIETRTDDGSAVQLINSRLDALQAVITEQDPILTTQLLQLLYHFHTWNKDVYRMVARFAADMCDVIHGPRHPLTLALQRLIALDSPALRALLEAAASYRIDHIRVQQENDEAAIMALEELFLAMQAQFRGNGPELHRIIVRVMDEVVHAKIDRRGVCCQMLGRLVSPALFYEYYDLADSVINYIEGWLALGEADDPYYQPVASTVRFFRGLWLLETGKLKDDELLRMTVHWNRYMAAMLPPEKVFGVLHQWLLGSTMPDSNPEKAARWESLIEKCMPNIVIDDSEHSNNNSKPSEETTWGNMIHYDGI